MEEKEKLIQPAYIIDFLKRKRHRILFTAVISLCALGLLDLLALLALPSGRLFSQQIHILLNRTGRDSVLSYPSGTPFNQLDIICPAVLKQVYADQNLASVIPFDKFEKLFSVVNYSRKLAILDADFNQKLAKRNLSIVDMNQLEAQYSKQLEELSNSIYLVNMEPSLHLTNERAVQVLSAIPQTWMLLFRKLEGSKLPQTSIDTNFEKKLRAELQTSHLIAIDRATHYNDQLLQLCDNLKWLQGNRSFCLPSGEYLDDLIESLQSIRKYQLDLLRQMVLTSNNLQSALDRYFVHSQILVLQQKLATSQMQYDSIGKSLSIIQAPVQGAAAGKITDAPQQVSIDANVFTSIADLVRSDSSNEIRQNLAMENVRIGKDVAKIQAELQYYQQILSDLEHSQKTQGNIEQFNQEFTKMVNNLIATSAKVNEFKLMITDEYLSSLQFYSPASQVSLLNTHLLSPLLLIVLTAGIWILLNLLLAAIAFARDFYAERETGAPQQG